MKRLLSALFIFACGSLLSNVTAYFNYAVFSTPSSRPFLETYLTVSGNTVKYLPVAGGYQASVNISWKILKGTEVIKASAYNLMSPVAADSLHMPSFIDNQRFSLENGEYTLELVITDNAFPDKKMNHAEKLNISFKREKRIYNSDIEILDSYSKSTASSTLSKNGYDLIPYSINYFPKKQNTIKFYMEAYNTDTVLGKNSKFVYSYYIENNENLLKQHGLSGFQKQSSRPANALLGQLDISKLPSGNYNLVIEIRDSLNKVQSQKKWFFQRQSDAKENLDETITVNVRTIEDFFNLYQSKDSLKQFIECLWPRSTTKEREWQQTQIKNKDVSMMRSYMVDYWKTESGDSLDPLKNWITYYKSVLEANALLKCGKQKGYYTDRGRVYLQYGKPDQRTQVNSDPNAYPYEIWQYYRIYDKATGRFFTNKKFVFANFNIADDCYKLIHSDVKGELYDEKWQYRLVSRTQMNTDIDNDKPVKTYGNNFDDLYNNPR